jgi:hypothetical protein
MRQLFFLSLVFALSCSPSKSNPTKTNSDGVSVAPSCVDFSGSYACPEGSFKIQQAGCESIDFIESGANATTFTWTTNGRARHDQPGGYVSVTSTAYHSADGLHQFSGSYDSYSKETVTYRRHFSKRSNGDLVSYYFKARNDKVEAETTTICNP